MTTPHPSRGDRFNTTAQSGLRPVRVRNMCGLTAFAAGSRLELLLVVPTRRLRGAGGDVRSDAEAEARVGKARSAVDNINSDRRELMLSYSTKQ